MMFKPPKIVENLDRRLFEQEYELEFPSAEQYKGQFIADMEAWESVVKDFPENIKFEIDGILYRLEKDEEINTGLLRQLAVIFRGNAKDERGQRIAKWLDVIADYADFFAEAVDIVIDSGLGLASGEGERTEADEIGEG
jgi:hypothetical protein